MALRSQYQNNYKIMPIVYVLALLLLSAASRQCTPSLYSLNLTTDLIQFSAADIQNNAYNFTFKNALSSSPQVALALTRVATNTQASLVNSQFHVFPSAVTARGLQIVLNSQGFAWIISRVCLWASTNTQLLLGSAPMQNLKPTSGAGSISLQFQISITSPLPVNNNQIARGFLNGLTCRGQLSSLTISNTAFANGKIVVNVNVQAGQLNVLWISFVVFNLNNGEFAAYGGYNTIGSNQSQTVDLLKGFSATQNIFYGINALQADLNFAGISVQLAIDSNFLLSYTSLMGSFVASYLFIGYPSNFTCQACRPALQNYYLNGYCVSQCPNNTVPITLSNGGQMCRPCPAGTGLIVIRGSCACPDAFSLQNGRCISSLSGIKVQYSNVQADDGQSAGDYSAVITQTTSQSAGAVILPLQQNINRNLNFVSSSFTNSPQTSTSFLPSTVQTSSQSQSSSSQTTVQTIQKTTIELPQPSQALYGIYAVSCPLPNSFFNGQQCVCIVGYVYSNGKCIIPQISTIITVVTPNNLVNLDLNTSCPANAYFNGSACVCNTNYYLLNNSCIQCPINSQLSSGACICSPGYSLSNGACIQSQKTICPANSSFVGQACVCNPGFYSVSGACSQCPPSAYWSSQAQKCLFLCGVNAAYNQTAGSCLCVNDFGRDASGNCVLCESNFYPANGYCATCPNNAIYNATIKQCLCKAGFMVNQQGVCTQKCSSNEVYNVAAAACDCRQNFSRIGSACMLCPTGTYFNSGQCTSCPPNSYLLNKKCVCSAGYAADSYGLCHICSSLPNAFMMNGLCVKCSSNKIYNATLGACQCPFGKMWSATRCVSICNNDEMLDKDGNCYTCGMNEIISNGVCTCQRGFTRSSCGTCTVNCESGSFLFMGGCGRCPLNMNYMAEVGGCVCPNGYYMDPVSNVCAVSTFIVPSCPSGSYYDDKARKCLVCPASCAACSAASTCTSCAKGFSLTNGICVTVCGDGLILGSEGCDSGQTPQAGCTQCQISRGYNCLGQPSTCFPIQINTSNTTNATFPSTPRLSLKGNISLNSNNIFLSLLTAPTFTFPNPSVMQNFLQANYVNTIRPATYCVQQGSPNLNTFDCLLIYPSGIPNTKFNVFFYFNYQGQAANLTVTIDPLLYASSARTINPVVSSRSP